MIISFGWTTPALLGCKVHKTPLSTCGCPPSNSAKSATRRDWAESHAAKFKAVRLADAWNTTPRNVRGNPHKVATIRIASVKLEETRLAPPEDWEGEGFAYLSEHGLKVDKLTPKELWDEWHIPEFHTALYVVRFDLVEIVATGAVEA